MASWRTELKSHGSLRSPSAACVQEQVLKRQPLSNRSRPCPRNFSSAIAASRQVLGCGCLVSLLVRSYCCKAPRRQNAASVVASQRAAAAKAAAEAASSMELSSDISSEITGPWVFLSLVFGLRDLRRRRQLHLADCTPVMHAFDCHLKFCYIVQEGPHCAICMEECLIPTCIFVHIHWGVPGFRKNQCSLPVCRRYSSRRRRTERPCCKVHVFVQGRQQSIGT
eukprot:2897831-Amphidinium_carterae.1